VTSRIGKGPWARALGAALVPDDTTPQAIRGEELWRRGAVQDLRVELGQITAHVEDCTVTLTAPTIPSRIWDAIVSYARNRGPLERAVRGETQSAQLDHLLTQDWDEPLIPSADRIVSTCSCSADVSCAHVAAVAHAVAAEIDAAASALLRWRVLQELSNGHETTPEDRVRSDSWRGSDVPRASVDTLRQTESVLKRLGQSGVRVAEGDLTDALGAAYTVFAGSRGT
jgi:uncharacterized Zn finger protein